MNGHHDPGPLPIFITKCNHCTQTFESAGVPIIGEPISKTYQVFFAKLAGHLTRKHPEVVKNIALTQVQYSAEWGGILMLQNFDSRDPELSKQRDVARHRIHKLTRKVQISDATIHDKVSMLALGEKEADVMNLLREMRDLYEERGLYPENQVLEVSSLPV